MKATLTGESLKIVTTLYRALLTWTKARHVIWKENRYLITVEALRPSTTRLLITVQHLQAGTLPINYPLMSQKMIKLKAQRQQLYNRILLKCHNCSKTHQLQSSNRTTRTLSFPSRATQMQRRWLASLTKSRICSRIKLKIIQHQQARRPYTKLLLRNSSLQVQSRCSKSRPSKRVSRCRLASTALLLSTISAPRQAEAQICAWITSAACTRKLDASTCFNLRRRSITTWSHPQILAMATEAATPTTVAWFTRTKSTVLHLRGSSLILRATQVGLMQIINVWQEVVLLQ